MSSELDRAYEKMGLENEKLYKPIICKTLGDVIKTHYKYCMIDFLGAKFTAELKSRNLNSYDMTDTMIGYNKVNIGFEKLEHYSHHIPDYKIYFLFGFKDGLFCWELNKETYKLNGGDAQKKIGGTNKRGYDDFKEHYYIKKEYLVKIDDTPCFVHPLVQENSWKPDTLPKGVCLLKFKK
jgi:hypothetical protein